MKLNLPQIDGFISFILLNVHLWKAPSNTNRFEMCKTLHFETLPKSFEK